MIPHTVSGKECGERTGRGLRFGTLKRELQRRPSGLEFTLQREEEGLAREDFPHARLYVGFYSRP
jgi:hypothetical protein